MQSEDLNDIVGEVKVKKDSGFSKDFERVSLSV